MRLIALLSLLLIAPVPQQAPSDAPADFAFRFEFGCADRDTIDTFAGTYSRTYGAQSVRIEVSQKLKRELYAAIQEARVLELPTRVTGGVCEPMVLSSLEVQANGIRQMTTWDSCAWLELQPGFPFQIDPEKAAIHRRLYRLESVLTDAFKHQKGVARLRRADYVCL